MNRLLTAIAVLTASVVMAACGVPSDSGPREINPDNVQYGLLEPSTTTTTAADPSATAMATVYLLNADNRLVAVDRQIFESLTVGSALASLIQGATPAEQGEGLRSAIYQQTAVLGAEVSDGLAIVDVSDAFTGVDAQEQIFALAQVVFSATEIEGVNAVQIRLNSTAVEVPRSDGTLTRDPLTRNDYSSLAPT